VYIIFQLQQLQYSWNNFLYNMQTI
jgi:hypothetical protein